MAARMNQRMNIALIVTTAGLTAVVSPRPALGQAGEPDTIRLFGVLRDFLSEHPDFGLSPADAPAHYVGNVQFFADGDFKPVYLGTGAEVATQWRDQDGNPIAPHLFNFGVYNAFPEGTGTYTSGAISMGQATVIDAWDSSLGAYNTTKSQDALIGTQTTTSGSVTLVNDAAIEGDVLVGPGADPNQVLSVDGKSTLTGSGGNMVVAPDPLEVRVPDFGASIGDVDISTNTVITNRRFECDAFTLGNTRTLTIEGQVEIVCHGVLSIGESSRINLAPGATLRVYTLSTVEAISQDALINANTMDPTRVTFFHMTPSDFLVGQGTQVYGTIYAPDSTVSIQNSADVFGRVLAERLVMSQGGAIHIDKSLTTPRDACNTMIDDSAGALATAHNGAVTSSATFRHWFRTVPRQNASHKDFIELTNNGAGVYEYATPDFTLADGKLLGDEGMAHNRNFTLELGAVARYDLCQDQFFEFEGDGDAWLLIGDSLVVDLGGQGAGKRQIADLDRLGLFDGEIYTLRFFYAQRTNSASAFKVRTNINMITSEGVIPDSSGLFD